MQQAYRSTSIWLYLSINMMAFIKSILIQNRLPKAVRPKEDSAKDCFKNEMMEDQKSSNSYDSQSGKGFQEKDLS